MREQIIQIFSQTLWQLMTAIDNFLSIHISNTRIKYPIMKKRDQINNKHNFVLFFLNFDIHSKKNKKKKAKRIKHYIDI
jgi:hypothetical protein